MSRVLVVGGAGYIGSHAVRALLDAGHEAFALDNLSRGHAEAVPEGRLVVGDCQDWDAVATALRTHDIDSVMHFAAHSLVAESVRDPLLYWENNVAATATLLSAMLECGVTRFVFSSTAATYGNPAYVPIDERHPQRPINPYGATKLAVERMLADTAAAHGLRYMALRYFNAAGAHPDGGLGERHDPETHLIPLVLEVPLGRRDAVAIFGDDYDTPDGTCVRDYIHVCDLADAHIAALDALVAGAESRAYNLGTGRGHSVREVIEAAQTIAGHPIPARVEARRPGDPPVLVATAAAACSDLRWTPRYADLHTIIAHAWHFAQRA